MFPNVVFLGKTISLYTIMVIFGIISCLLYIIWICKKEKIDDNNVIKLLLVALIGAFIGGHLLYAITKIDLIILFFSKINKVNNFKVFIDCMYEIFGGSVFYGGLIGALLFSYIYVKRKNIDKYLLSDLCAPLIPLFHFFGRIGCFLTGCCYGIESKIGFTYKHSLINVANGVNRFPIQLVEAFYNLILFILLTYFYKKGKLKGKLIYVYLILYSIGRYFLEFFRGDEYRGFILGISTSQFISILIIVFVFLVLVIKYIKNEKVISKNIKI